MKAPPSGPLRASAGGIDQPQPKIMDPDSQGLPHDVLIVEDDAIIALDFEDTILGFGVKTVRSCGSVARALQMIAERAPDFVLLDVALVRERSFAVAEKLQAMQIPFVFITGYGRDLGLPPSLKGTPMLPKPCASDVLEAALRQRAQRR
jgi:CheY-like chemotaxis protein